MKRVPFRAQLAFCAAAVLYGSCAIPSPTPDESLEHALKGVFAIGTSPSELKNFYTVQIFGRYNYDQCEKLCPVVDVYVSVIGEGDPPEMEAFYVATGYAWKLDGWDALPIAPLTDSNVGVQIRLSRIPIGGPEEPREALRVSVDLKGVRVTKD